MNKEIAATIDLYLKENRTAIVEDLKTLVRIPSVSVDGTPEKPFGENCALVLDTAVELANERGMRAQRHGYRYGTAEWGAGERTIGIFSHLDVVPEGNGWKYPPYEPTEKDGWLIGRGVVDDKAGAIAGIYVTRCLAALGVPFASRISLYLGCSEERGMEDIESYVREQPMPDFSIVPDTHFPVCHGEKGILEIDTACNTPFSQIKSFCGGLASNVVPDRAEARLEIDRDLITGLEGMAMSTEGIEVTVDGSDIVVRARGVSAHASRPQGSVNAIARLAAFLSEARGVSSADRAIMAIVADALSDSDGSTIGIAWRDEPSGELTCISGVASTQEGVLNLNLNIRYPVTDNGERSIKIMHSYFEKKGFSITHTHDSPPSYLPKDDPKVRMLCAIYADITGKAATPYIMGGGTYARKLKNAIGFGLENDRPLPFTGGRGDVHQPDEALYIDDLLEAIKIYTLSLIEVDRIINEV